MIGVAKIKNRGRYDRNVYKLDFVYLLFIFHETNFNETFNHLDEARCYVILCTLVSL